MSEEELFKKHPLPWKHQILMITDANGKTVIHLGGTRSPYGTETMSGSMLCTLAGFIVETANARSKGSLASRIGERIDSEFIVKRLESRILVDKQELINKITEAITELGEQ